MRAYNCLTRRSLLGGAAALVGSQALAEGNPGAGGVGHFENAPDEGRGSRPLMLPTIGLVSAYSVKKLAGYAGPAAQVTRVSDSATQDIGFSHSFFNKASADAFAAATSSTVCFSKWYDQIGSSVLANATLASMMVCNAASEYGGIRPLTADGSPINAAKFLRSSGTIPALDRSAMTVYLVANVHKTWEIGSFWEYADAGYTTNFGHLITNSSPVSVDVNGLRSSGSLIRIGPSIMSISVSPTTIVLRIGGRETTLSTTTTSQLVAALQIGQIIFAASYAAGVDYYGMFTYAASHSSATMQGIEATLAAAFGIQNIASFRRTFVYGGSSLISAFQLTRNQNPPWVIGYGKNSGALANVECFNVAPGGTTVTQHFGVRTSTYGAQYDATKTAFVSQIDAPSNDIAAQTFTSAADANVWVTDFFGTTNTGRAVNTVMPFVAYLKALGTIAKPPIVPTIIARGGWNTTTNWFETARLAYNALLLANAASMGCIVADRAAVSQLQDPTNRTFFNADQTHLNDNGSANFLAPVDAAAQAIAFAS